LQYLSLPICHYWPGVGFRLAFGIGFAESVTDASLKAAAKAATCYAALTIGASRRKRSLIFPASLALIAAVIRTAQTQS
jgi:hypothetical protein